MADVMTASFLETATEQVDQAIVDLPRLRALLERLWQLAERIAQEQHGADAHSNAVNAMESDGMAMCDYVVEQNLAALRRADLEGLQKEQSRVYGEARALLQEVAGRLKDLLLDPTLVLLGYT